MSSSLNSNDKIDNIKYIIGIVFGMDETSAAICKIDTNSSPEDIDLTGTGIQVIPSTMYIETNDDGIEDIYIGRDAVGRHERNGKGVYYERFMALPNTMDERKNLSIVAMRLFMREVYKIICQRRSGELVDQGCVKKNHLVFVASPPQIQGMDNHMLYYYTKIAIDAGLPIAEVNLDLATIDIRQTLPFLNNHAKLKLLFNSIFPLQNAIVSGQYSLFGIVRKSWATFCEIETLRLPLVIIEYNYESIDMAYYMSDGSLYEKSYLANAFEIEEAIYNYLKEYHSELGDNQNPDALKLIEQNYRVIKLHCLYRIRQALENYYRDNSADCIELSYRFEPRLIENRLDVEISAEIFNEQILRECIKKVESAFEDFKRTLINNDTITAVVLSGECSHRDYVQDLAKTIFGEYTIYPLWSVPRGVASVGRNVVKFANNTSYQTNTSTK